MHNGSLAWLGYHSLWKIALGRSNVPLAIAAFYGAAFVYPIWLLVEAATTGFASLSPVHDAGSRCALSASAALGFCLPAGFLWPAFFRCSIERRQRGIALYRLGPVIFSLLQLIGERALLPRGVSPASPDSPYLIAGLGATAGHWYAVWGVLVLAGRRAGAQSPRSSLLHAVRRTLAALYLPRPAETNRPGSSVLAHAAHEFLQYDMIILAAAYLLYPPPPVPPLLIATLIMNPSSQPAPAGAWERLRKSCDACQDAKVKCTQHKPSCHRCLRYRQPCVYSPQRRTGRPPKRPSPSSRKGPNANNASSDAQKEPTRGRTSDDHPVTEVSGIDPWVLTGDFASAGVDPVDDVLQSTFETFLAASTPPKDGIFQGHNSDPTTPNGVSITSPSISDPFGGFLFPMPDPNGFIAPLSSHVPPIDQLPMLSAGASNTSGECGDCGAKCYSSVLQQLLFLRQTLPETTRPSIDVIMQAECHVRALLDQVLACNGCMSNRSSVLLMSTITERIVQMLDWIIEEKTLKDTENMRSNRRAFSSWGRPSRLPPPSLLGSPPKHACHIPLRVGNNALDEDAKQYFLKQFILLRLKQLAAKVQEVRRATTARPGDCIYRAAELVLTDSIQRLDYLRGQCQLWE
ncbi:hypothetical protein BDW62DRAFT_219777 [Aspergillus aurantiobrunneus]